MHFLKLHDDATNIHLLHDSNPKNVLLKKTETS